METIVELIQKLPDLLSLKPATEIQITDAEIQLRIGFAKEYREYLAAFGAVMADGIELSGIAKSQNRNVVSLTEKAQALNPQVPKNMYVVEDPGIDGIIIWQNSTGEIFQTCPGTEPKQIASSLSDYIRQKIQ